LETEKQKNHGFSPANELRRQLHTYILIWFLVGLLKETGSREPL